jgi:hypothetical protein
VNDACDAGDGEALPDGAAILARVDEIDSVLRKCAGEAERVRRLSQPAVEAIRWAGGRSGWR